MGLEVLAPGLLHVYYIVLCSEVSVQMLLIYWCLDIAKPTSVEWVRKKQFIVIVEMKKVFTHFSKFESDAKYICLWNEQQKLSESQRTNYAICVQFLCH